ncbi:MAG: hypothetical protein B6U88_01940 [Candidatus Aenigmarchaeota archaeon ex4484_56]|nr:MAG: hypothetical protein B6U88_01940 [Candidatus Aenigmarchaeota archaeon ex4484_56]
MYYILKKEDLHKFINLLKDEFEVIAPVRKNDSLIFDKISSSDEIVTKYINTDYPPKDFFLESTLYSYEKNKHVKLHNENKINKRVIYGIRPCDVNALLKLDKIFCGEEYYRIRRQNTKIIAITCNESGDNCFCTSFGTDHLSSGFDLLFTDTGKEFYIKVGSDWGRSIVKNKLFRKAEKHFKRVFIECERFFLLSGISKKLEEIFKTDKFNKYFKKCLSCSACSVVCPLCYCFDIVHRPELKNKGKVEKILSSCLLKEFTRIGGNHVFREDRVERYKQYLGHKFIYSKKQYRDYLCVGCGRCISHCPVDIDFEKLFEEVL